MSQDSVYVKTRNKQSGQKRRGGDSSRRQGPDQKRTRQSRPKQTQQRTEGRKKTQGDNSNYTTGPFLREWTGLENGTSAGEQVGRRTGWTSILPRPVFGPCWLWCPGFGTFDNLGLVERDVHMAVAET